MHKAASPIPRRLPQLPPDADNGVIVWVQRCFRTHKLDFQIKTRFRSNFSLKFMSITFGFNLINIFLEDFIPIYFLFS